MRLGNLPTLGQTTPRSGSRRGRTNASATLQGARGGDSHERCVGLVKAATVPAIDKWVINIGGGEEVPMKDLAMRILRLLGDPIEAEIGSLPERRTEISVRRSDPSEAVRPLGTSSPRSLDEALVQMIDPYRQELEGSPSSFSA
jgi:hypothetical protein